MTNFRNHVRSSVRPDDSGLANVLADVRTRKNKIAEYQEIAREQNALAEQELQAIAEKFRTTNIVDFITSRCKEKSIELKGKFKIDDDCDMLFPSGYWADVPNGEATVDHVISALESLGIPKDHIKKNLVTSKDTTPPKDKDAPVKNRPTYYLYITLDDVVVEGMIQAATKDRFAPIEGKLKLHTPPTDADLKAAQQMIEDETGHEVIGMMLPKDKDGNAVSFSEAELTRIYEDIKDKVVSDLLHGSAQGMSK